MTPATPSLLDDFLESPLLAENEEGKYPRLTGTKKVKLTKLTKLFKEHTENSKRWNTTPRKLDLKFAS